MLGESLVVGSSEDSSDSVEDRLDQLREAERLLLDGYNGLKDDSSVPPPSQTGGEDRKRQALERIIQLYEIWHAAEPHKGHNATAADWRTMLGKWEACTQPVR